MNKFSLQVFGGEVGISSLLIDCDEAATIKYNNNNNRDFFLLLEIW